MTFLTKTNFYLSSQISEWLLFAAQTASHHCTFCASQNKPYLLLLSFYSSLATSFSTHLLLLLLPSSPSPPPALLYRQCTLYQTMYCPASSFSAALVTLWIIWKNGH